MDRVRAFLTRSEPTIWHFWGDSITHGARHTYGMRDYYQHFEERIRYEMSRKDDAVLRMAVSGYTTRHLLERFDAHVTRFRPDVMFLMIGMNDCAASRGVSVEEFAGNLGQIAQRSADVGCLLVMQTTCPVLPGLAGDREPNFNRYMDAVREVARQRNLPLVDHAEFWMQQSVQRRICWMDDAFHPNAQGHLAFARFLMQSLGIHDADLPTGRLFLA